jgi:hypothetical protein
MSDFKELLTLIQDINGLILHYGMNIASDSEFRLTTLTDDGKLYYQTSIEQERKICEKKLQLEIAYQFKRNFE